MKRTSFIVGSAATVALAGCGGGNHTIPSVGSAGTTGASHAAFTYVPVKADAVPASVLGQPIIGEARRFDGSTAPALWMLAQGQTLQIKAYPELYGILKTVAGGDGKTTFKLPATSTGWIVAVAGTSATSPTTVQRLGRKMRYEDSLGAGALPRRATMPKPVPAELAAARALVVSRIDATAAHYAVPVSADFARRIAQSQTDAAARSLGALSPASRAQLDASVENFVAARASLADAIVRMMRALSPSEARALLDIGDTASNALRDRPVTFEHPYAQLEAARYLMSVAVAPDRMERALANGAQ